MLKVGLTGNIAAGKSEVEKIIEKLGIFVLDLDKASHEILENDCCIEILKEFKTLDRKKIGKIVFSNATQKRKLEEIIHPVLKEKIEAFFKNHENEKLCVVSGALIFEAGFEKLFDKIIFIDANKNIRLERLIKRNNLKKEDALLRINSQNTKNKKKADFTIENDSDFKNLETETAKTIEALKLL